MSKNKLSIRKMTSTQEVILLLEKDLQDLKATIKVTSRLKGSEKATALARIDRRTINNIDNLLMSLETSILTEEEDHDYHTIQELKQEYHHFEATFDQLKKELEFTRNEGKKEQDIFQERNRNNAMSKQQYAQGIEKAQQESEQAVKNMLRMLHETKDIGATVNAELERQLDALDSINQNLRETESNMNRALRHINYFARSVYTDKLLIVLIVLIVMAIVAIIIISAIGKTTTATEDALN